MNFFKRHQTVVILEIIFTIVYFLLPYAYLTMEGEEINPFYAILFLVGVALFDGFEMAGPIILLALVAPFICIYVINSHINYLDSKK